MWIRTGPLGRHYAYGIGFEPIVDLSFDICESCRQVPYVRGLSCVEIKYVCET
jgi:hypothetical protein